MVHDNSTKYSKERIFDIYDNISLLILNESQCILVSHINTIYNNTQNICFLLNI